MKLSDIKGERTLEVIADIISPIANIASDDKASELFVRKKLPDGKTVKEFMLERIATSLPILLKEHKVDIIKILSTIEGTSVEKYSEELNLAKLLKDVTELLTDEAFLAFFTSTQSQKTSGSVLENTEGR